VINALMIDVDGVIVEGRPADGRHWSAELDADLGISRTALQSALFKPHWERIVTGQAELHDCLTRVLAEIAPHVTADRLLSYWFEHDARLNHRFLQDLASLRAKGMRAFLATNQEHSRARYLMETLELSAYVDGCYYSAEIGQRKPRVEFFQVVALRVALPPDNLLLIDDSEDNVGAARAAGWRAARWTADQDLSEILATVLAAEAQSQRDAMHGLYYPQDGQVK
jgi:putative hydrolase of the HAD superfamily